MFTSDGAPRQRNRFSSETRAEPGSPKFQQIIDEAAANERVSVNAPPEVVSQIARVHGRLHVLLANFTGVVAKRNVLPEPVSDVVVSFGESAGSRVRTLPFLGDVSEIAVQHRGGKLVAKIPAFTRSVVVWCE